MYVHYIFDYVAAFAVHMYYISEVLVWGFKNSSFYSTRIWHAQCPCSFGI